MKRKEQSHKMKELWKDYFYRRDVMLGRQKAKKQRLLKELEKNDN